MCITVYLKFSFSFLPWKVSPSTTEREERSSKYINLAITKIKLNVFEKQIGLKNYNLRNSELWTDITSLQLNQSSMALSSPKTFFLNKFSTSSMWQQLPKFQFCTSPNLGSIDDIQNPTINSKENIGKHYLIGFAP